VDSVSMSLSMNVHRRAPRMPRMPRSRPAFLVPYTHAQGITDLRIKRLGVRIPPGARV